jgi:5-methylcytosine-specific restriction enzyme B
MKDDIKEILSEFLDQTEKNDHRTNHYPSSYCDLELKVGFGIGRDARIPWVAFLGKHQTPQEGIFPVFYFFKEYHKLILAYGISETKRPKRNWIVPLKTKTVIDYFKNLGLSPHKYHQSYVYEVYSTIKDLDWKRVETDLVNLITKYKGIV